MNYKVVVRNECAQQRLAGIKSFMRTKYESMGVRADTMNFTEKIMIPSFKTKTDATDVYNTLKGSRILSRSYCLSKSLLSMHSSCKVYSH